MAGYIIVEIVDYVDTGYVDPSGAPVPEAKLVGFGECWVLTNGVLIKGTVWHDSNVDRARTKPSSSVTVRQVGCPAASPRNSRLPVEPWKRTRSPSRAYPTGTT